MGLSIYYRLKLKTDAAGARRFVKRLHAAAAKLQFDEVSGIEEYDPPDGRYVFERGEVDDPQWKPGRRLLERKRADGEVEHVEAPSLHAICFHANHAGSETASFGLATHPPVIVHREDVTRTDVDGIETTYVGAGDPVEFPTQLRGWYSWSAFCKTQYASNPKHGGIDNFLRVHTSVFRLMDEAKRLGATTHIRDDTKYWRNRDERKLAAELQRWDEIIAGFAGRLGDKLGSEPGALVAPIKDRPDFEHLEARGEERLAKGGRRRGRRGDGARDEAPS